MKGNIKKTGNQILAVVVSAFMIVTMTPAFAFADTVTDSWTGGHLQHDAYCGYAESAPCIHENGEHRDCGYDLTGTCSHLQGIIDGNGSHDESCGYSAGMTCIYDSVNHPQHSESVEATCMSPAQCVCGAISNNGTDPLNHAGGTEFRGYKDAGPAEDGYTGDTYCLGCGEQLASGEIIPAAGIVTPPDESADKPEEPEEPAEEPEEPEKTVDESDEEEKPAEKPVEKPDDSAKESDKPLNKSLKEKTPAAETDKNKAERANNEESVQDTEEDTPQQDKEAALELYKKLGITLEDLEAAMPEGANEVKDPVDEQGHPLRDYTEQKIYNLLISEGNRNGSDPFAKNGNTSIHIQDVIETASKDDLEEMLKTDGIRSALGHYSNSGVQARNVCAVNLDEDRADEIAIYELLDDKISIIMMENDADGSYQVLGCFYVPVENLDGFSVEAMATKGLMSMAAGDYDRDGVEELAFYVPGVSVKFAELVKGEMVEITDWEIPLSEIRTSAIHFEKWRRPIVSLDTTSISGEDDLVVNIAMPLKDDGVYKNNDHLSTMAILSTGHTEDEANASGSMEIVYSDQKLGFTPAEGTSNNKRHSIRFASAEDADVNGDGVEELLVAGFRTQDFNNSKQEAGKLDDNVNLIHAFSWNEKKAAYEQVWDNPIEVPSLTGEGLNYRYDMQEPAAFAAGHFAGQEGPEQVFLEGVLLQWSASGGEISLETGTFSPVYTMTLAGRHNAFISTAFAANFAKDAVGTEQLVFMSGHEKTTDEDLVYYDIGCVWPDENGLPQGKILYDNYVDNRNEDDSGTYLCICPMDNDPSDSIYYEYQGKETGWTDPELLAVFQPTPYWNESASEGSIWWTFSKTEGAGTGENQQFGIGPYLNVDITAGAGIADNKVLQGGAFSVNAMVSYIKEETKESTATKAVTLIVDQGRDHGDYYTAVLGIPLIRYHYRIWIPEFVVTEEYIETYNELAEVKRKAGEEAEPCGYQVGETVPGQFNDVYVDEFGKSTYVALPLDEYNEIAEGSDGKLMVVSDDMYPQVTPGDPSTYPTSEGALNALLGKDNISLEVSDLVEVDNDSSTESRLEYVIGHSENKSKGYNITANASGGVKLKISIDLFVAFDADIGFGLQGTAGGGEREFEITGDSTSFSGTFCEFNGFPDSYNYSTQLAVYKTKVEGDDKDEFSGPYVMSYIVQQTNGAPPKLAENFLAQTATADTITLTWENPDYRTPESYKVYIRDKSYGKNAEAQEIGLVRADEELTFTATGLDPDTTYDFAIVSYGDREGDANPSCMSPWITQRTKSDSERYPNITQQPQDLTITDPADAAKRILTVTAEPGQDSDGSELRYQWQRFDPVQFAWVDAEGGTADAYTVPAEDLVENGSVFYRVIVTQMHGSQPFSVHSNAAAVIFEADNANVENKMIRSEMTVDAAAEKDKIKVWITGGAGIPDGSVTVASGDKKQTAKLDKNGYVEFLLNEAEREYIVYYSGGKSPEGEIYLPAIQDIGTFR